jgi:hypothetical protein
VGADWRWWVLVLRLVLGFALFRSIVILRPPHRCEASCAAYHTDPRSDPITVRRGNRERYDALQECGGIDHLLGEKDANELAVLFSEGDSLLAARS